MLKIHYINNFGRILYKSLACVLECFTWVSLSAGHVDGENGQTLGQHPPVPLVQERRPVSAQDQLVQLKRGNLVIKLFIFFSSNRNDFHVSNLFFVFHTYPLMKTVNGLFRQSLLSEDRQKSVSELRQFDKSARTKKR